MLAMQVRVNRTRVSVEGEVRLLVLDRVGIFVCGRIRTEVGRYDWGMLKGKGENQGVEEIVYIFRLAVHCIAHLCCEVV